MRSLAMLAISGLTLSAQQSAAHTPTSAPPVFANLNLTLAQQSQIKDLTAEVRHETVAITQHYTPGVALSPNDYAVLRRVSDRHNAAVRALLTPEQLTRLDSNLAAYRAQMIAVRQARSKASLEQMKSARPRNRGASKAAGRRP